MYLSALRHCRITCILSARVTLVPNRPRCLSSLFIARTNSEIVQNDDNNYDDSWESDSGGGGEQKYKIIKNIIL